MITFSTHCRERLIERNLTEEEIKDRLELGGYITIEKEKNNNVHRLLFFNTQLEEFCEIVFNNKENHVISVMPSIWRAKSIPDDFLRMARQLEGLDTDTLEEQVTQIENKDNAKFKFYAQTIGGPLIGLGKLAQNYSEGDFEGLINKFYSQNTDYRKGKDYQFFRKLGNKGTIEIINF